MSEPAKQLSPTQRKVRKLRRDPVQFVSDSKAYVKAQQTVYFTWAKLGSFALVIAASLVVVAYYSVIASPRFASESQFVVKKAGSSESPLSGLMAIGSTSPSMRDALILQKYIQSREMATALEQTISLKAHYENEQWDWFSRLAANSSVEDYLEYYQQHIKVQYDEMSEVLQIEVQAFDSQFSLTVANKILELSETFINKLGQKMVKQQLAYAQQDVTRAYDELKQQQTKLVSFQDKFKLYNPEQQGSALVSAMNELEAEIIKEETALKSLTAFMRSDSAEIKAKQIRLNALKAQLEQEKSRLTNQDQKSLNKINIDYQEIKLNSQLATDLYQSSLASLELIRSEAFRTLKHLLVIEPPALAQEDKYPRRLYSIFTWFISLILIYGVGRMIMAVIKEHKE